MLPYMGLLALTGIGAGVIHALAGPDHVLSLVPLSLGRRRAWRVGLWWGLGHGAGTACWALGLALSLSAAKLEGLAGWSDVLAGVALIAMGILGMRRMSRQTSQGAPGRNIFWIGLIHGAAGGAVLLLLLLAMVSGSALEAGHYLLGFIVGSTVAMVVFTALVARLSHTFGGASKLVRRIGWGASVASVALGAMWILRGGGG